MTHEDRTLPDLVSKYELSLENELEPEVSAILMDVLTKVVSIDNIRLGSYDNGEDYGDVFEPVINHQELVLKLCTLIPMYCHDRSITEEQMREEFSNLFFDAGDLSEHENKYDVGFSKAIPYPEPLEIQIDLDIVVESILEFRESNMTESAKTETGVT